MDSCKSVILASNISDNFFVFGIFDHMKNKKQKQTVNTRYFTEKNDQNLKQQLLGKFRSQ